MRKLSALFTSIAMVLALGGCASARKAGTYEITLEENPDSGYVWSYALSDDGIVRETASSYQEPTASPAMDGAGGTHVWQFEALKEGTVTATFSYEGIQVDCIAKRVAYEIHVDANLQITGTSIETDTPCGGPTVTDSDMGTYAGIEGNQIEFTAGANPGYEWKYAGSTEEDLKIVSIEELTMPYDNGSGAAYYYTAAGLKEGTAHLVFTYGTASAAAVSEFFFTVQVDKDLNTVIAYDGGTGNTNVANLGLLNEIDGNTVVLSVNQADGYSWTLDQTVLDTGIASVSDPVYSADSAKEQAAYTITGLKEGTTETVFLYRQAAADAFTNSVDIRIEVASDLSVKLTQVFDH